MRYPYLLFVRTDSAKRVSVRSFKTDATRQRAIAKLPDGASYETGEQLQILPVDEETGSMTYDPRYEIPF